ncbi:MAG: hypothetical protein DI551_00070 [Micavibrio aeruginosavorus]|uniref:Phasin domain-containing protein n=1 Tax=Micavibrio aeruginosavorus TaxID=349221 RepID=A0A2W5Q2U2_9BACT|nr:MAG: hypothetical protein DI551_00070 [Micavibrio aeruginosavorus]
MQFEVDTDPLKLFPLFQSAAQDITKTLLDNNLSQFEKMNAISAQMTQTQLSIMGRVVDHYKGSFKL